MAFFSFLAASIRTIILSTAIGLLFFAPQVSISHAQSSIKVLVNDQPITTYDVNNRLKLLRLTSRGQGSEKQAIEELIDEKLKIEEAARRNIRATLDQVNSAYAGIAQRVGLSPAELSKALQSNGVDPSTLRDRLAAEIAWTDLVGARFRATVRISDRDVANALAGDEANTQEELDQYDLQQILFIIPQGSSEAYAAQRRREAESYRNRFAGCEVAIDQAKDLKDVVVRPKIRRDSTQIGDVASELSEISIGQTTRPVRVNEGYQLVAVCDKRSVTGESVAGTEARSELANERGEMLARRYLRDLRSDAVIAYR